MAERSPFPDEEGVRLEEDEETVEALVLLALLKLTSRTPTSIRRDYSNGTLSERIQQLINQFKTGLDSTLPTLISTANYGSRLTVDRLSSYSGNDINTTAQDIDYILEQNINEILNSTNTAIEMAQLEESDVTTTVLPFVIGLNSNQAKKLINYTKANQGRRKLEDIERTLSKMRDEALTYRASLISTSVVEDVLEEGKLIAANQIQLGSSVTLFKTWNCSFINSCQVCIGLHGESVPINSAFSTGIFRPKAHPHCHCALTIDEVG